jgi:hypothetical protein
MGDPQPLPNPVVDQQKVVKQNVAVPTDLFSMEDSNPPVQQQQQQSLPVQSNPQTLVQQSSIDILGAYNQNRGGSVNMVSIINYKS